MQKINDGLFKTKKSKTLEENHYILLLEMREKLELLETTQTKKACFTHSKKLEMCSMNLINQIHI